MNFKKFNFGNKKDIKGVLSKAEEQRKKTLLIYGSIAALAIVGISYVIYKKSEFKPPAPKHPPAHFIIQNNGLYKEEWRASAQQQITQLQQQNQKLQQQLQMLQNTLQQMNSTGNTSTANTNTQSKTNNSGGKPVKSPPLTSLITPPPSPNNEVIPPPPPPPSPPAAFRRYTNSLFSRGYGTNGSFAFTSTT